jgi:serine/threonine protein kinase
MTRAGEVLSTLSYMAPEQATSGAAIDARTDIFGVGATLFHALSGVRPFDAAEPGGGRTPLGRIAPWVHRDLAAVVERALQRSPDAWWSTADDIAANGKHSVRLLTAQKEAEVGDDEIIGRLCRPGGSRAGAGQTLP